MKKIIFKYELKDAWNQIIRALIVDKDNKLHLLGKLGKEESVSSIGVDKINKILQKYEKEFKTVKNEELPFVPVMDGYINDISFTVNDKKYSDSISNLCYYEDEDINSSKHLRVIFNILDDIYEELYSQNKEISKYFVVAFDEDDEE